MPGHEATGRPIPPWRALVYEQYDPTGKSLERLRERAGDLTLGYALWRTPFWRFSEDEFIGAARGCVAEMGASSTRITRRVIEALFELCFISKFGIGVDSIDVDAATEHGVLAANTPEESQVTTVGEQAIAQMLAQESLTQVWRRLIAVFGDRNDHRAPHTEGLR
jgi:D-3-phosphoglycerate dehydrogenase